MAGLNIGKGALAPLFERLVDDQPLVSTEARPFRTVSPDGLRDSIRNELQRLLNTRCSQEQEALRSRSSTVLDYGVPDFTHLSPTNPTDRKLMQRTLGEAIANYEPRLRNVSVQIGRYDGPLNRCEAKINGVMIVGNVTEAVSFPTIINRSGVVEVAGA